MRKKIKSVIFLAIVFLSINAVFGQAKKIDRKEYQDNVVKSLNDLRGKIYRSITINETFTNGESKFVEISKRIYEILPPDRTRWIFESDEERKEIVQIGQRRFVRINNGEWKEDNGSRLGAGMGVNADIEYELYKVDENAELNGRKIKLYERSQGLKNFSSDKDRREVWTTRFWITKDGVLMQTQNETEDVDSKFITRTTTDYEYNPKDLKIEAPIK